MTEKVGGGGWIRTNVDVRQRIYSPSPLATRAPLQGGQAGEVCLGVAIVNDAPRGRADLARNRKKDFFLKKEAKTFANLGPGHSLPGGSWL